MKGVFVGAFVALVITLNGFTVMLLWNWFITPLGVSSVTLWQAAGIDVLFTMLSSHKTPDLNTTEEKIAAAVEDFVKPLVMLFFGWVIHQL